ncbi:MAG TPA: DUF2071 domain-containing protein [Verrucomicrobiae bacterium]|nr:DUF2071 domain-containing protein [Verrucomicrobiae bacterium]
MNNQATANATLDRITIRLRPPGAPVLLQNWENLLFLHWHFEPHIIRPLVPNELELDLFDNKAWIGISPFALTGLRLPSLPPIPGTNSFFELNVRTYVHFKGKPGIYFFSLDASKTIPTLAARFFYFLPYFKARMTFSTHDGEFIFASERSASKAEFFAKWKMGKDLGEAPTHSLEFFLVERYAFFVKSGARVYIVRVHHAPWTLHEAAVQSCRSTMIEAAGIAEPASTPLAHFSRFLAVEVWEPQPS